MLNLRWNFLANSICYCRKSYFVFPVFPDASPGFLWIEFYSLKFLILSRDLFTIFFFFFFFWYLWDLSRLFVRINFASSCRITSIFNRASFTLLAAQVYFLWITNFDKKFSCFAINSIDKHVEWQWQQNEGIIIALKNLLLLLILFFVNTRGVHRNYVLGTCFLTETCYLLWD